MIILSIITTIISLLIQGTVSNYIGYTYENLSVFSTIYVLISLLVVKPHFENEKKYLILLISFGLMIDITYTSTFLLNTCLFIIVYYFTKAFHFFVPYNLFTINASNLLSIFLYHIISFLFLTILQYDQYTIWTLIKILTNSIIMTIIYTSILYFFIETLKNKLELKNVK